MTIGLAILVIAGVVAIVGGVWTIATIRANDKTSMSKEISEAAGSVQNAVNRLEKKVDTNHEQVHGRQNESIKVDGEMREKYGYLKGQNDLQNSLLLALISNVVSKN